MRTGRCDVRNVGNPEGSHKVATVHISRSCKQMIYDEWDVPSRNVPGPQSRDGWEVANTCPRPVTFSRSTNQAVQNAPCKDRRRSSLDSFLTWHAKSSSGLARRAIARETWNIWPLRHYGHYGVPSWANQRRCVSVLCSLKLNVKFKLSCKFLVEIVQTPLALTLMNYDIDKNQHCVFSMPYPIHIHHV